MFPTNTFFNMRSKQNQIINGFILFYFTSTYHFDIENRIFLKYQSVLHKMLTQSK